MESAFEAFLGLMTDLLIFQDSPSTVSRHYHRKSASICG